MKYNYYYPDSVAEFQDYGNDWYSDPFDDFKDTDNPVDLINDIKESDMSTNEELKDKARTEMSNIITKNLKALCDEIEVFMKFFVRDLTKLHKDKDHPVKNFANLCNTIKNSAFYLMELAVKANSEVDYVVLNYYKNNKDKGESNE